MMNVPSQNPRDWREGRRLRAWELHQKGWKQTLIAEALGVTSGAVSQWLAYAELHGPEALRKRKAPGAQPKLSQEQKAQLPMLLGRGAEAFGFRGDVWTTKRIAEVIRREFGVSYHKAHVARLLHELGWSQQKPLRQAYRRDEKAIQRWKENEWSNIHRAEQQGYTVLFLDEAAFYLLPGVVRTWAPEGETPILHHQATRDHLSTIAAITPACALFMEMQKKAFDSSSIVDFLICLQRQLGGKLLIVWDSIPIHRSGVVKRYIAENASERIRLKYFPGYASDLLNFE